MAMGFSSNVGVCPGLNQFFQKLFRTREVSPLIILLGGIITLRVVEPSFGTAVNLWAVSRDAAIFAVMGAGMTAVILTGGIDLSVASILAFSAAVTAKLMMSGTSVVASSLVGLLVGTACGMTNAGLITIFRVPPIIATLGTMGILRATTILYTDAKWIGPLPLSFAWVGTRYTPFAILVATTILVAIFLSRTKLGRYVYAVGGNEEAVHLSGVNPRLVKFVVYTLNGLLASVAGLILASSMSSAQSNMAVGYELSVIAAVVIGGTSISGGKGSVLGTVVGAAIMAVLSNALILLGVPITWHKVLTGIIILSAVLADRLRSDIPR